MNLFTPTQFYETLEQRILAGERKADIYATYINLVCAVSAIVLAGVLMRKLLPHTRILLSPKTDSAGNPQFEE